MAAAKSKHRGAGTIPICINVPVKLMRRLNVMLGSLRNREEYSCISRSAFLSHALAEWTMILDDAAYEPAPAQEVRRRLRPAPRTRPNAMSKLDAAKVRAIRKDKRMIRVIARDLGVAASTVARARSGATWRWVRDTDGASGDAGPAR